MLWIYDLRAVCLSAEYDAFCMISLSLIFKGKMIYQLLWYLFEFTSFSSNIQITLILLLFSQSGINTFTCLNDSRTLRTLSLSHTVEYCMLYMKRWEIPQRTQSKYLPNSNVLKEAALKLDVGLRMDVWKYLLDLSMKNFPVQEPSLN